MPFTPYMKNKIVKEAINALAPELVVHDSMKFFEENKDDKEFILFLKSLLIRISEIEEKVQEKLKKEIGEDLANTFQDIRDKAYWSVDKHKLNNLLFSVGEESEEEIIDDLKDFLKKCHID